MSQKTQQIVLLNDQKNIIGYADKNQTHNTETPFHLAFSCYLFNDSGEILLTRRSLNKLAWPGVWTNSFCGHPLPEEKIENAVKRRALEELKADINNIYCIEQNFSYIERDKNGIVENEFCPIYIATLHNELAPIPSEVIDWAWIKIDAILASVKNTPFIFSPWMVKQLSIPSVVNLLKNKTVDSSIKSSSL
ncbi:isopentenyl-diphosphate Delta-isomerase [Vibrio natriegens]|uniref:isopentenyl-diphosphate Delta-isomerase n=1 Tax=Vibrio natriegens TaxID=691 RepID=UPI00355914D5